MTLPLFTAILLAGGVCSEACTEKAAAECCDSKSSKAQFVYVCESECADVAACCDAAPQTGYVLSFGANWCGPCQQMAPVVKKLATRGVAVRRVDIDRDRELAARYDVTSIPTFVAVVNGREVERLVGATSEDRLLRLAQPLRSPVALRMAAAVAPGATNVQTLVRATYELPAGKAKALTAFLKEMSNAEVETRLDGENLTVTTTPEAQRAIGQFIAVLPGMTEPVHAVSAGKAACCCKNQKAVAAKAEACPAAKKSHKTIAIKVDRCKGGEVSADACESQNAAYLKADRIYVAVPAKNSSACGNAIRAEGDCELRTQSLQGPHSDEPLRVEYEHSHTGRPVRVRIEDPKGRRALLLSANRIFIERLHEKVGELRANLEQLQREADADAEQPK